MKLWKTVESDDLETGFPQHLENLDSRIFVISETWDLWKGDELREMATKSVEIEL